MFLISVVGAGMWLARNDPDTDWGPIILGAMALIGMVLRSVFKIPEEQDDGYGRH